MTTDLKRVLELAQTKLLRKPAEPDEHALAVARHRGEQAEQLLKHELLAEAFTKVEAVYMDAWRNSDSLDIDRRERAWVAVGLLADLKNALVAVVREGEAATKKVAALAQMQSRQ